MRRAARARQAGPGARRRRQGAGALARDRRSGRAGGRSRCRAARAAPRVYFEVNSAPYAAGESSFIGETLARLGARNIVPASLGPFPKLNPEFVVRADPRRDHGRRPQRAGAWRSARAGQRSTRCASSASAASARPRRDVLVRPGPRMAEAARHHGRVAWRTSRRERRRSARPATSPWRWACLGCWRWRCSAGARRRASAAPASKRAARCGATRSPCRSCWDIRLPRTLGAWLAGALAGPGRRRGAGAVSQSAGRSLSAGQRLGRILGVALALVAARRVAARPAAGLARLGLTGAAFVGAVLAVVLTLALARGVQQTLRLLLAGVIVGVVLGAVKDLIAAVRRADIMQAHAGLHAGQHRLARLARRGRAGARVRRLPAAGAGRSRRRSTALALGEATARSLGLPLPAVRAALVAVLALATGAAVAQTGLIAFVGLAAPHLVRSVVKTTHALAGAAGPLMGGALLHGGRPAGALAARAAGAAGRRADRGARRRLPAVADAPARRAAERGA